MSPEATGSASTGGHTASSSAAGRAPPVPSTPMAWQVHASSDDVSSGREYTVSERRPVPSGSSTTSWSSTPPLSGITSGA